MNRNKVVNIEKMSVREFINHLHDLIMLSPDVIINLYKEDIDGEAFLLMARNDLAEVDLSGRYIELCCHFPTAKFVNDFFE